MTTVLAHEQHIAAPEIFDSLEADYTVEAVQDKLDQRLDLEAVAVRLALHQPGDPIDMAAFERPMALEGLAPHCQPHFYRQYVSDKRGAVSRTSLDRLNLSQDYNLGDSLVLEKREDNQDFVQAFKVRGAMMAVLERVQSNPDVRFFATASAGNHALGLLQAVRVMNNARISSGEIRTDDDGDVLSEDEHLLYQVHIYCSRGISQPKYDRLTRNGAKVFKRDSLEAGLVEAKAAGDSADVEFIHPFDDETVIAGQATLGLELLFDLVDQGVDLQKDDITLRIPVGGGGLFAGVASVWEWAKSKGLLHPKARLVAAEMELCDSASRELNGRAPLGSTLDTDTEGLATQTAGRKTLPVIEWYSDGGVTVVAKEYVILAASELAKLHGDHTPELAAVVSLAATLQEADQSISIPKYGRPVIVTLTTGRNIAPEMLTKNSRKFEKHRDVRVAAAAAEIGHRAMRLAYLNVSAEHLRQAAQLERDDPSVVLLDSSEWHGVRQHDTAVTAKAVAGAAGYALLNGATTRSYVPSPLTGL